MKKNKIVQKLFAGLMSACVAVSTFAPAMPVVKAEDTAIAPVLEYNFDEALSGTTVKDSVGTNNGTLYGEALYEQDPDYGQVLYLDGSTSVFGHDSYLQFPDGFFDGRDNMTISMDVNAVTRQGNFFTFGVGQDNTKYLFLKTLPTSTKFAITTEGAGSEQVAQVSAKYPNTSRVWINIKMVVTPTSLSVYRDGKLIAQNDAVNVKTTDLGTNLKAYVGKSFYSADKYFRGYFDNIKVYDQALTAEQVQKMFDEEKTAREAWQSDLTRVADSFVIPNANDIRGNITLPSDINGVSVKWTSSDEKVISTKTVENENYDPTPAGVVTRQKKDTNVTLTAVFSKEGAEPVTKSYQVTVKKAVTAATEDDYTGYLFVRFDGNELNINQEQTYFSVSRDGLNWENINNNQPVLKSTIGESGLRDHFIGRSAEGDKFYMIATDLSIYDTNVNWGEAGSNGSHSIMVWESEDLVRWSEPWLAEIAPKDAGCTWAPEFIYDDRTGEYVVYWSATTLKVDENENIVQDYENHSIYYCKTRDFRTFTDAKLYRQGEMQSNGYPIKVIDSTMIQHDGTYYRFTKNETTGNLMMDKSEDVLGTFTDIPSQTLSSDLPAAQGAVEGPIIFKMNEKTADGQDQWCLYADRFARGAGYYPLITTDLDSGNFRLLSSDEYSMPAGSKFRHGYVLPITEDEYLNVTEDVIVGENISLNYTTDGNGTIEGKAMQSVKKGADGAEVTAVPNAGYKFVKWSDGVETAARTDKALRKELNVVAIFEKLPVSVVEQFTDVEEDSWFKDAAQYAYDKGLMEGLKPDEFGPAVILSRGQFATILWRMENKPVVEYRNDFKDVPNDDKLFYKDAVMWASSDAVKIITGYTDGSKKGMFGPADYITREQMAVMMYRYMAYKDGVYEGEPIDLAKQFPADGGTVSTFAKEAMSWAVDTGLITGNADGTLAPQGTASRAVCATILQRYLEPDENP